MKANSKIRRQVRNDDRGVSEVIGGVILIGIVAAFMTGYFGIQVSKNYVDQQTQEKINEQKWNATIAEINAMKRIETEWNNLFINLNWNNNSNSDNGNTTEPEIQSQFNKTTGEWHYFVYQNYTWIELVPYVELETPYTLTVVVVPAGRGSVTVTPQHTSYSSGATVELNATASPGWCFMRWSGNLTGTTNPTTITMNSNKTVYATFNMING